MAIRIHDRDDGRPAFGAGKLGRFGAAYPQHDIGIANRARRIGDDRRAGCGIIGIRIAGFRSRPGLDRHFDTEAYEFLHCFRRCGDSGLAWICFGRHGDPHENLPLKDTFNQDTFDLDTLDLDTLDLRPGDRHPNA
jgi:hypothetical protein